MYLKLFSAAPQGIDAVPVTIEVHAAPGYDFTLVGLPDGAVKEAHERIISALTVCGYEKPKRTLTVNMAPADIKKEGAAYDLPLAIGMLAGDERVPLNKLSDYMIMGELSLDGTLRPIQGVLPIALCARKMGLRGIILPYDNAAEAAVVKEIEVYGMTSLNEVITFLNAKTQEETEKLQVLDVFRPYTVDIEQIFNTSYQSGIDTADFSDVRGQENVRRAMEVAAAGGHNMLMVGPPGAGKSMMAKRMPTILPPLTMEEALETTKIHSVAGLTTRTATTEGAMPLIVKRPFRAPHHTITDVALVGGGTNPRPGEISLAHNGVLFLDELPEYKRTALEVLRQPLEDRKISVVRNRFSVVYPASFMLVAAMNPCPCGHYGENNPAHPCTCTPAQVHRYMSRISGPLLDRIDIQCDIQAVAYDQLRTSEPGESSASIRERVVRARRIQSERFREAAAEGIHCNAQMTPAMLRRFCQIDEASDELLSKMMTKLGLSARAYDRILKVSRTIADLAGEADIKREHLMEALSYRSLDRDTWGI